MSVFFNISFSLSFDLYFGFVSDLFCESKVITGGRGGVLGEDSMLLVITYYPVLSLVLGGDRG